MKDLLFHSVVIALNIVALTAVESRAVSIAWTAVGDPGNAADPASGGVLGGVPYGYSVSQYDVTNSQYVDFLNAKDSTGANLLGLYNIGMSDATFGGVSFNAGNANGSKYSVISGNGNHPANYVTFFDAVRFANWLNNGQGNGDTESGAYTLQGGTPTPSNANNITRNSGAQIFVPSLNEWYKAAYFNPATNAYFQYPTSSNTAPLATVPAGPINSANYNNAVGNVTNVGAYLGTTSPYGAYDMGGNVWQWTDTKITLTIGTATGRVLEGGAFTPVITGSPPSDLSSGFQLPGVPTGEAPQVGFRVAMIVPEPSSVVLATLAIVSLVAYGWRRKRSHG